MDILSVINSVNWTTPSWDLFVVIFFVMAIFLYGFTLGKDRIIVIMLSTYITLALIKGMPASASDFLASIKIGNSPIGESGIFLGVVVILFFLLSRSITASIFEGGNRGSWGEIIILGFLQVGLLMSVLISFLPSEIIGGLSPFIKSVFADDTARSIWLIAPILAVAIFSRPLK